MGVKPSNRPAPSVKEARYQIDVLGEAVYEKYKKQLEQEHLEEVAALDIDKKEVAGVAPSIHEALELAERRPGHGRLIVRRIGPNGAFRAG